MKAELLHVFTARFNPIRWTKPHEHFMEWAQHMLDSGVKVHVAEVQYGERPFECIVPGVTHVGLRAYSWSWAKESAIMQGIYRAPEAKYCAVIDSDVFFRNPDWAKETVHALQHYEALQPWKTALDLGPSGELMSTHRSFCDVLMHGQPVVPSGPKSWKANGGPYDYPHSGFAWAYKREMLDRVGGMIEIGGMGSGDHHMALALAGRVECSYPNGTSQSYKTAVHLWQDRAQRFVNGRVGAVPGIIEHRFHGTKQSRKYQGRWDMFLKHGFDPVTDLKRNSHGILEFAGNKPELEREWDMYLRGRNEDANINLQC